MSVEFARCRLRKILAEKRVSQDELALKLGMKKSQISAYTTNRRMMTLHTAKKVSRELNVLIDDLYEWE